MATEFSGHTEVQTSKSNIPQIGPGWISRIFKFQIEESRLRLMLISWTPSFILGSPHLCPKWSDDVADFMFLTTFSSISTSKLFVSVHSSMNRILKVTITIFFNSLIWLISIVRFRMQSDPKFFFTRFSPPQFSWSLKQSLLNSHWEGFSQSLFWASLTTQKVSAFKILIKLKKCLWTALILK